MLECAVKNEIMKTLSCDGRPGASENIIVFIVEKEKAITWTKAAAIM
jgi:hypothetical protein